MQLPTSAASEKWPGLRACLTLMLGAGMFCAMGMATPAPQARDAAPGGFAGGETCATCHEEVARKFPGNPHAKMTAEHGAAGVDCEGCHGPGKAHVDGGGDAAKIFNPAKATAQEADRKCLGCHQGKHANFERSAHGEGNVGCIGCHSIHGGKGDPLLRAAQTTLCYPCHTDVKPQFAMTFHHKVNEGLVQCTDCHDPHSAVEKKSLKASAQQDTVCTKCHAETAGPFVYEHAVVKTEGCTACHTPHGGANPRLLNRANVDTICLQCHSPSTNFSTLAPAGRSHNQAAQSQSCTGCHKAIHGSNVSGIFFNPASKGTGDDKSDM